MSTNSAAFDANYTPIFFANQVFKQFAWSTALWGIATIANGAATAQQKLLARTIQSGGPVGIAQVFFPAILADATYRANLGALTDAQVQAIADWLYPVVATVIVIPS